MPLLRVIKRQFLKDASRRHPKAETAIAHWETIVRVAQWKSLNELRQTFASADQVKVNSGRLVTVFNIGGNDFRLITAIHYPRGKIKGRIFLLRFLTHAEYSRQKPSWKDTL